MQDTYNSNSIVVQRLIEFIQGEGLTQGDRLPSIRQLSSQWNMNTNVVRDGLLQAQTMGLIRMLPRSGAFVQSMDFSSLVDALSGSLETALMQQDHNLFHLMEARRMVEVEVVGQAAARRRPEDMLPLRQALDFIRNNDSMDREAFVKSDERFHLGLANVAGNPVLCTILQALLMLLRPHRSTSVPDAQMKQHTEQRHEEVFHCVMVGDVEGAQRAIRKHLSDQSQKLLDQLDTST